ncbi:uncharacterized protein A1O9_00459 [Exophiala aquamarina CBS 119918]|uniref:Xylanolytic transcriptional activator regulatory domain-containing protein n=1 Tax=Exophiala aquamarina CBS 119918 TaxID=1182545 RepID=A0A072PRI5_9EURO|nr:uncharacterized protein A1O9_00459 [Exophiala aquamarina CBS 119918]KEF62486.1 hypothetical protein A1O9_00459 [Exophiala aquamarina CBS 119918]
MPSSMLLSTSDTLDFWSDTAAQQIELGQHGPPATAIDLQPKTKCVGDKKCSIPAAEAGFFLLQEYLVDFNAAVPLFDRVTISTCFEDCYNGRAEGSVVSWIVMKLVLAIAHRLRAMSPLGVRQDTESADIYLAESLSDLSDLIMLPPSLILCQCYIAFAVVISTSSNPKPAATFISMALRVTQDLRINDPSPITNISPRERLQRQRVFWIAFLMDADRGLKAGRAPSMSPELITIDLPASEDPDGAGEICAIGGEFQMNIFRLRAELSLIMAELMELLQTPEASRNPRFNGDLMWQTLALRLDTWREQWPGKLTVNQLQKLLHRSDLVHIIAVEAGVFSTLYLLLTPLQPDTDSKRRAFSPEGLKEQLARPQSQQLYHDAKRLASLLSSVPAGDVAINW